MRRPLLVLAALLTLGAAPAADQRRFLVSNFDRVRVDGPFDVEIVPGMSSQAEAEGEDRALRRLLVRVEGSTLVVGVGSQGWDTRGGERLETPSIRVTTPDLRAIQINGGGTVRASAMRATRIDLGMNGAGSLEVRQIEAQDVNATLTGTGAMTLSGKTARARVQSNGAGSVDAGALIADEGSVVAESSGDTALGVRYTARVLALGRGKVRIVGAPECRLRGPGPIECGGTIKQ